VTELASALAYSQYPETPTSLLKQVSALDFENAGETLRSLAEKLGITL
jgi:hypothetical protein